jgi:two-component system LytT family response regulator
MRLHSLPSLALPSLDRLFGPGWLGLGFAYWLALVCALEPGNLANATVPPPWAEEITRLLAAGALGGAATPAVLALAGAGTRARAPILPIRILGVLGLAFVLIVISCVLAAWLLERQPAPSLADIQQELSANFVLLVFGLSIFLGFVSTVRAAQTPRRVEASLPRPDSLVFSERGRTLIVQLQDVEWVESQGNYQAVRAQGAVHLVRRTLEDLEADLDPERFVRIHRRTIVGLRFVRAVTALSNGDARVSMADGQDLRVARGRRANLSAALAKQTVN